MKTKTVTVSGITNGSKGSCLFYIDAAGNVTSSTENVTAEMPIGSMIVVALNQGRGDPTVTGATLITHAKITASNVAYAYQVDA